MLSKKKLFGSHLLAQYPFETTVPTGHESRQTPLYLSLLAAHLSPVIQMLFFKSKPELQLVQKADDMHEKQFELQASQTLLAEFGYDPALHDETHDPC